MDVSQALQDNTSSIRQAIQMTTLRQAMNQNASAVGQLLQGMQRSNARVMENSVTPYKGGSIDVRV